MNFYGGNGRFNKFGMLKVGKMRLYIPFLFFLFLFIGGNVSLWAAGGEIESYVPLPVIKTPTAIKSAKWNRSDSNFAYSEQQNIYVRDASTMGEKQRITADDNIRMLKFAEYGSKAGSDQLLSFSEGNTLDVRLLPNDQPSMHKEFLKTTNISAMAFSNDGTYVGIGTDSGQANIFMQLYMTGDSTTRMLLGHKGLIYSVAFSHNGRLFATASRDGTVRIWNVQDGASVAVIEHKTRDEFPIAFTPDGNKIIVAKDQNRLAVRNFDGSEALEINCEKGISDFTVSGLGNSVIVRNPENEFEYYNLGTGEFEGYIPPWNETDITAYDFSHDEKRLLIGHEDGSLYIVNVDDVKYKPGEKPSLAKIKDVDDEKKEWLYNPETKKQEKMKGLVTFRTSHNIETRASFKYASIKQYDFGFGFKLGYTNDYLLNPFYIGAVFEFTMFFPGKRYPSTYYHLGTDTDLIFDNPYLLGYEVGVVFGREWQCKKHEDWSYFFELTVGGAWRQLSLPTLGTGEINSSLFGGVLWGFKYRSLVMFAAAGYDSTLKFNASAGFGYRFRIWQRPKTASKPNAENAEDEENGETDSSSDSKTKKDPKKGLKVGYNRPYENKNGVV